jgi:hypothetical protein
MGAQSAFVRLILSGPSTNVMTTNITQLAIEVTKLALAWQAQPADPAIAAKLARARVQLNALWPVVLGLLTGTITGAFAYAHFDLWSVSAAVALAAGLAPSAHHTSEPAPRNEKLPPQPLR